MDLEEENRLLRGTVVDPNTDIDAYLELRRENEFLKFRINNLIKDKLNLKRKLYEEREESSLGTFIRNLFK